jgi:hypothetical protein
VSPDKAASKQPEPNKHSTRQIEISKVLAKAFRVYQWDHPRQTVPKTDAPEEEGENKGKSRKKRRDRGRKRGRKDNVVRQTLIHPARGKMRRIEHQGPE